MLLGTLGANFLGSILISGNRKIKKTGDLDIFIKTIQTKCVFNKIWFTVHTKICQEEELFISYRMIIYLKVIIQSMIDIKRTSMVYNLFDETSRDTSHTEKEISENKPIANELHKPITREYKRYYLHLSYDINLGLLIKKQI